MQTDVSIRSAPAVKAIADMGQASIPLLIKHLDDTRPTQATYHHQPVPVAYLALDMLLHMTDMNDERTVEPQCSDEGLGACMQPQYYFPPDTSDLNAMQSVKAMWKQANEQQPIRLVYPTMWR